MKIGDSNICKKCCYWQSPEFNLPKDCQFPWFDYTEKDKIMMECHKEAQQNEKDKC